MKFYFKQICMLALAVLALSFISSPSETQQVWTQTFTTKKYSGHFALGFLRNVQNARFMAQSQKQSFLMATTPIPGNYSMRNQAGPVENQGQCGSCWDFSLTSVLRGTLMMAGHDPGRLSFNYLLDCDTQMQGCNGGNFSAAQMLVSPDGPPAYGTDGQYTGQQAACTPSSPIAMATAYHMLGTNGSPSFKDIAYVVGVLHRPVSVDVTATNLWQSYSGGVYNGCDDENPNDINHMVSIEGYSCESSVDSNGNCVFDTNGNLPPGVGYWIIRNSWGTSWGDHGYITTKATDQNGNRCNSVATDALYFDVASSPNPPPPPPPSPSPNPPPNPPPQPAPSVASTPSLNGQSTLNVTNPYQTITFSFDVSNFPNAAATYYEVIGPNINFSQQNGIMPDPRHLAGTILPITKGGFYFMPARSLPGWGTYYFRVIPLNSTGQTAVGQFSNTAVLNLHP